MQTISYGYAFTQELIAENRFSSKDPKARNTMLALASMFGTRNVTNTLDLLDSCNSSSLKGRWTKNKTEKHFFPETETVVTEFVASLSGRTILQVR